MACRGGRSLDRPDSPGPGCGPSARGVAVVVDANLRPSAMQDLLAYRRNVMEALREADIIKASDEYLEILKTPGATALERARSLLNTSETSLQPPTLAAQGACLLSRDGAVCHARRCGSADLGRVLRAHGAGALQV